MSGLDKSLDDLINEQKKKSKGNKSIGKNRKGNLGASKKLSVSNGRIGKKRMGKKMMMDIDQDISGKRWRHDKFKSGKSSSGDQPKRNQITRVQVTNLALGVTNKDINVSLCLYFAVLEEEGCCEGA
ncbi:hypothetical protein Gasu_42960 isoform 1 [Galdieria sulphuraria]|uniref:Uncharacterized protein n=1 Tax=Galdieria sulphuraria TaxID=130081 RepID=M2VXV4_GALSU|nr:hypothetical protein Gasu_42960 isoform 1 [Galdieria sulphuraria]EME28126.1 hypothetical protein Gasu_42960 isoform 1 [Galdieria sulphuraria]|eukprot:XP_005704646.1 hypothetical protein isoform 1 [Galdieria sulphuraria]